MSDYGKAIAINPNYASAPSYSRIKLDVGKIQVIAIKNQEKQLGKRCLDKDFI